ncbi:beta-ketoacyl-[acyl-carrier-protein] synthase family protein [Streptomyces niger]|uniref:beta-ketoacyl-[acyl-carrier-protein] synthase family protein n=1 Tax=Streptomyces niger TaxID=66373 RepID=UPI00069CAEB7|nr:beta-ketoacyl-[acyl-carrier-protein] synthase family protein [Streptomyces niger]
MTQHDVAVTGMGLVTPAGIGTNATWSGLCAGWSTATIDPAMAEVDLPVAFSCRVPGFDPDQLLGRRTAWRMDRFTQMALVAVREAVCDAGLQPDSWDGTRVGVVLGVAASSNDTGMPTFRKLHDRAYRSLSPTAIARLSPNMAAGEVSLDVRALGPSFVVSTACASGTTALGVARDLVRSGTCDIVLAGGSESPCTSPFAAAAFHRMGALSTRHDDPGSASRPFDADRDGFVLGEGAAVLVLENARHARARGARPHAYLSGYAANAEAHHPTIPRPDGEGLARCLATALTDARIGPEAIDHINTHGTATRLNDEAEARALHRVFHRPPPVTSIKSVIGHSLGAAGAIEAAASILSLTHQHIPPTANHDTLDPAIDLDVVAKVPRPARLRAVVSTSAGFGGQNAVVVLTAP